MTPRLADGRRVCLLTGAGGTLGTAFCRTCRHLYRIAAVYRRRPPLVPSQQRSFVDPLKPRHPLDENRYRIFEIKADLTEDGEAERVVDVTLARFGRIDLVVNAAGMALDAPFTDMKRFETRLTEQLLLNAMVPIRIAVAVSTMAWRDRLARNARLNRNVVNVSSTSGLFVYDRPQRGAYGASKAALNFLSCHLASDLKRGIRVNVLAPTTFPALIPTERVVKAIVGIDRSSVNGRVLMMNVKGNRWL